MQGQADPLSAAFRFPSCFPGPLMRNRTVGNTQTVMVMAALVCSLRTASGQADGVQARAQDVSITRATPLSDNFESYSLKFNLQLKNRSAKPINVPAIGSGDVTNEIEVQGVQARLPDGSWATITMGDWLELNPLTTKYPSCGSVPAGSTAEFKSIMARLDLLKERWMQLGRELTIRLYISFICTDSRHKVFGDMTTEPFSVHLTNLAPAR